MKKSYCAPMIEFEDFTLCTSIAAGCENKANFVRNTCAYVPAGNRFGNALAIFTTSIMGCEFTDVKEENDGSPSYNGICYHVPTESNNLFAS